MESSLTDQPDNLNWVSNVQYDFAGHMTSMTYLTGNASGSQTSVSETRAYNAATGQLTSLNWSGAGVSGGIQYGYSATQNNGQITQATDTVSGETIVYPYDAMKRLTSASSTPTTGSSTTPIPVNATSNQLTNAIYDANGNMTSGVGATLTYDEGGHMIEPHEVFGGREYYGYDGSGIRCMARIVTPSWIG